MQPGPVAPRGRPHARSSGATHRKPLWFAAPALLALLAALAAAPAAAQTTVTLVSNIGEFATNVTGTNDRAQPFTTGSNANGYTLSSIDIVSNDVQSDSFAVSLYTTNASGHPDTLVATLTVPGSFDAGTLTFTAPANTTLAASTVYTLRVTPGSNNVRLSATGSNNEDAGAAAGWSIADGYFFPSGGTWSLSSTSFRIAVKGYANTADTTAPAFASAAANGASLVITFDEDLAAAASLANSAFTVKKTASGGSEATVALSTSVAPVISGTTVTLTLGTALVSTDGSVRVTYTKPTTGSANKLVDAASNETATFTDQTVTNNTPAAASCTAPSFGTRRDIWTGTVTVGSTLDTFGNINAYGFSGTAGDLDDKTFNIGSNNYVIDDARVFVATGSVRFSLNADLTTAQKAALRLHVCDTPYDFSTAMLLPDSAHSYRWTADLDWSSLSTRTLYLSLPANHAATGTPTISGTATVGQTLMAVTTALADADGLPTTFTYQWVRVDGLTETDITGATSSTYTLASADSGKKLKVKVGFTDNLSGEEERKSDATGTVTAVTTTAALVGNFSHGTHPSDSPILGSAQDLHQAFTTGTGGATLTSIEFKLDAVTDNQAHPTVTLHSGSPTSAAVATLTAPAGDIDAGSANYAYTAPANTTLAASTTYYVVLEGGGTVFARSTIWPNEDSGGQTGWSISNYRGVRTGSSTGSFTSSNNALHIRVNGVATPAAACAAPNFGTRRDIWTGTVTLGTFTGGGDTVGYGFGGATGDLDDKTFTIGSTSSYEIDGVQVVVSVGSDDGDILLYLNGNLTAAEKTALKLHVCDAAFDFSAATLDTATHTYTFVADLDWSGLSTRTLYLSLPANNAATGKPTITGPGTDPNKVGSTLTAAKGDIADTDGVPTTLSYQWVRVDGSNETDIDGATSSSYTLALEDTGLKVKVKASFTDNLNSEETRTSDAYPSSATIVGLPAITIAPGQAKATGKFDYIHYTLTRAGATTAAQTVTVTLDPPAGNDWNIPNAKLSHDVTFTADSATATLSIWLNSVGYQSIGFSSSATMSGTLTARIGAVAGFDNRDTAEVEVVVVPDPVWVFSLTETAYSFAEDGGGQTVTVEARASSPDVPAPTSSSGDALVRTYIDHVAGTATTADYGSLGTQVLFADSAFSADMDGHQRARKNVTFTPTNDSLVEPYETLTLTLSNVTGYASSQYGIQAPDGTIGGEAHYPVTIKDNDTGLLSMAVTSTPALMATGSTDADLYGEGNMIEFTATFNNEVTVSGTPEFEFVLGSTNKRATYVRGSDSTELVFSYTVVAADADTDGISWAANKIVKVSSATIREMGETTDAVITHALQGALSGHKVDGSQAGVDRPAVSIAAVHDTAAPFIAHPEFRVTLAEAQTSAVTVNLTIAQGEDYLAAATQTIEIPANMTSATGKFASTYTGATGGTLTATVAAGTGYMPAESPDNAASVNMVAPGKAALLGFEWSAATYSVTEGDGVNVTVTLRTGANVPGPRETISVYDILTGGALTNPADTATPSASGVPGDYTHTSAQGGDFAPGDWVADGSVFRATRSHTIQTVEDTAYEGTERFKITLSNDADDDVGAVVSSKSETIVTIVDDEALKVTGVAVTSTPNALSTYGAGETLSFTATFRGPVTVTGTPQLSFSLGGVTKQAAYASGSDSTELVLSYTVAAGDNDADGISWAADALSLNGGTIKFMTSVVANRVDAALTHAAKTAQSGHKVDTAPVLSTRTVDGAALVFTYNETLDMNSTPASAFTVTVGGTAVPLASSNPVTVSGTTVTLTLATALTLQDATVRVSYVVPGSNPLQDAGGKDAAAFTDLAVTNLTTDGPTLTEAVVDGTGLVLTFGDPLNTASAPGSAAFTVKVGGTAVTQASSGPVAIAGSTVTLTLAAAVAASDTVTVSYAVPQTNPLRDADDLDAPAFDDRPVTNRTIAVPAAPGSFRVTAGNTQAELAWSAPFDGNSPITKYRYRYAAGTTVPSSATWTDAPDSNNDGSLADEREVTVTGLTNETQYAFEVQALNSAGEGPAAGARATPIEDPDLPTVVLELRSQTGDRTVTLEWGAPLRTGSHRSIDYYEYRYAEGSSVPTSTSWATVDEGRYPFAQITGLENGRSYVFEVRAVNRHGFKGAVATLTATPLAPRAAVVEETLPSAPRGLSAAGSRYERGVSELAQVELRWEAPADFGNTSLVRYEYRYAAGGESLSSAEWYHGSGRSTRTVRNLAPGTAYRFEVRAVTLAGAGPAATVRVTTPASGRIELSVFTRGAAVEGVKWLPKTGQPES